jgi:hypothetical protein
MWTDIDRIDVSGKRRGVPLHLSVKKAVVVHALAVERNSR